MRPMLLSTLIGFMFSPAAAQLATSRQAIVNGTRAPQLVNLSPEQIAAIGFLAAPRSPSAAFCTGTLISDRVVLTAEHCVTYRGSGQLVFGLGKPDTTGDFFEVEAVYKHPDLDIALLRLATPVTQAAPLAWQAGALAAQVGDEAEAAGYGDLGNGTQDGRFFVVLPIVGISATAIEVDGGGQRGICQGDSGGPLLMMINSAPTILAVESTGDDSCVGRDRMIRTAAVEDWIDEGLAGRLEEIPPEGCGALDFLGRCNGDVAEWCDPDGVRAFVDCAREGQLCTYVDDDLGFFCVDRASGGCEADESSCAGLGLRRYCIQGQVRDEDCAAKGLRCEVIASGAWCVDAEGDPVAPAPVGEGCCRIGGGRAAGGWWLLALLLGWRLRRTG